MLAHRPKAYQKFLFKLPLFMYKIGLAGWEGLIGAQWMLIVSIGRKTGKRRETLVDVIDYDQAKDVYFIEAAFGARADWFKNIKANPVFEAQVGKRKFKARAEELNGQDAGERLVLFYRKRPAYTRSVMALVGLKFNQEDDLRDLGNQLTLLAVRPLSPGRPSK